MILLGVYKPTYNLGAPDCTTYTTDLLKPNQGGLVTAIQSGWILGVDAQIERQVDFHTLTPPSASSRKAGYRGEIEHQVLRAKQGSLKYPDGELT